MASLALLAACAGPAPVTQRVEIPVFTPCVKVVPQRPAYEFDKLDPAVSDGRKVMALARDWARSRKYEAELMALLIGCL
ncbi:MAG: hypothetical protein K2X55_21885 [Burkholderiaceae bacterium]|nr:hypothetical protein [Burkholderiaceae bacterium]